MLLRAQRKMLTLPILLLSVMQLVVSSNEIRFERNALEVNVPGVPGQDYTTFHDVPSTTFSCRSQQFPGYYADVDVGCQVFHVCQVDGKQDTFLCPNGTILNQQYFVCDWWYNFNCASAKQYYALNAHIHRKDTSDLHVGLEQVLDPSFLRSATPRTLTLPPGAVQQQQQQSPSSSVLASVTPASQPEPEQSLVALDSAVTSTVKAPMTLADTSDVELSKKTAATFRGLQADPSRQSFGSLIRTRPRRRRPSLTTLPSVNIHLPGTSNASSFQQLRDTGGSAYVFELTEEADDGRGFPVTASSTVVPQRPIQVTHLPVPFSTTSTTTTTTTIKPFLQNDFVTFPPQQSITNLVDNSVNNNNNNNHPEFLGGYDVNIAIPPPPPSPVLQQQQQHHAVTPVIGHQTTIHTFNPSAPPPPPPPSTVSFSSGLSSPKVKSLPQIDVTARLPPPTPIVFKETITSTSAPLMTTAPPPPPFGVTNAHSLHQLPVTHSLRLASDAETLDSKPAHPPSQSEQLQQDINSFSLQHNILHTPEQSVFDNGQEEHHSNVLGQQQQQQQQHLSDNRDTSQDLIQREQHNNNNRNRLSELVTSPRPPAPSFDMPAHINQQNAFDQHSNFFKEPTDHELKPVSNMPQTSVGDGQNRNVQQDWRHQQNAHQQQQQHSQQWQQQDHQGHQDGEQISEQHHHHHHDQQQQQHQQSFNEQHHVFQRPPPPPSRHHQQFQQLHQVQQQQQRPQFSLGHEQHNNNNNNNHHHHHQQQQQQQNIDQHHHQMNNPNGHQENHQHLIHDPEVLDMPAGHQISRPPPSNDFVNFSPLSSPVIEHDINFQELSRPGFQNAKSVPKVHEESNNLQIKDFSKSKVTNVQKVEVQNSRFPLKPVAFFSVEDPSEFARQTTQKPQVIVVSTNDVPLLQKERPKQLLLTSRPLIFADEEDVVHVTATPKPPHNVLRPDILQLSTTQSPMKQLKLIMKMTNQIPERESFRQQQSNGNRGHAAASPPPRKLQHPEENGQRIARPNMQTVPRQLIKPDAKLKPPESQRNVMRTSSKLLSNEKPELNFNKMAHSPPPPSGMTSFRPENIPQQNKDIVRTSSPLQEQFVTVKPNFSQPLFSPPHPKDFLRILHPVSPMPLQHLTSISSSRPPPPPPSTEHTVTVHQLHSTLPPPVVVEQDFHHDEPKLEPHSFIKPTQFITDNDNNNEQHQHDHHSLHQRPDGDQKPEVPFRQPVNLQEPFLNHHNHQHHHHPPPDFNRLPMTNRPQNINQHATDGRFNNQNLVNPHSSPKPMNDQGHFQDMRPMPPLVTHQHIRQHQNNHQNPPLPHPNIHQPQRNHQGPLPPPHHHQQQQNMPGLSSHPPPPQQQQRQPPPQQQRQPPPPPQQQRQQPPLPQPHHQMFQMPPIFIPASSTTPSSSHKDFLKTNSFQQQQQQQHQQQHNQNKPSTVTVTNVHNVPVPPHPSTFVFIPSTTTSPLFNNHNLHPNLTPNGNINLNNAAAFQMPPMFFPVRHQRPVNELMRPPQHHQSISAVSIHNNPGFNPGLGTNFNNRPFPNNNNNNNQFSHIPQQQMNVGNAGQQMNVGNAVQQRPLDNRPPHPPPPFDVDGHHDDGDDDDDRHPDDDVEEFFPDGPRVNPVPFQNFIPGDFRNENDRLVSNMDSSEHGLQDYSNYAPVQQDVAVLRYK